MESPGKPGRFRLARARPEPRVLSWFAGVADDALYLSVLTLGELRNGVESLPRGARRERLRNWLEHNLPGLEVVDPWAQ